MVRRRGLALLHACQTAEWRAELLDRTWAALAADDASTGRRFHLVLRLKADIEAQETACIRCRAAAKLGSSAEKQ